MAFSTVLSVEMIRHENACTTGFFWAFSSQTSNFSVFINFIVLQNSKLDLKIRKTINLGDNLFGHVQNVLGPYLLCKKVATRYLL